MFSLININQNRRNVMTVLVLSGAIGAGKSTLTQIIADELGTTPFFEEVQDNPILPLFYDNPEKYAFLLQIFFLNKRFASIKKSANTSSQCFRPLNL